jgi:hypothetical protein
MKRKQREAAGVDGERKPTPRGWTGRTCITGSKVAACTSNHELTNPNQQEKRDRINPSQFYRVISTDRDTVGTRHKHVLAKQ